MTEQQRESMKGKVVLITGATSGIGRETALGLARKAATLVLIGRSREKLDRTLREITSRTGNHDMDSLLCDLTSMESVRELAADFMAKYRRLDVLINNAGGIVNKRRTTVDGYEYTLALDHLSHFLMANLLMDIIKASAPSRIVNVSSWLTHSVTSILTILCARRGTAP